MEPRVEAAVAAGTRGSVMLMTSPPRQGRRRRRDRVEVACVGEGEMTERRRNARLQMSISSSAPAGAGNKRGELRTTGSAHPPEADSLHPWLHSAAPPGLLLRGAMMSFAQGESSRHFYWRTSYSVAFGDLPLSAFSVPQRCFPVPLSACLRRKLGCGLWRAVSLGFSPVDPRTAIAQGALPGRG